MKLLKARKELKFVALISILLGAIGFVSAVIFFLWLHQKGSVFLNVSSDEQVQAVISHLFLALKIFLFIVLPSCSGMMLIVGWCVLRYLRMDSKEPCIKLGSSDSAVS
jgi:hypothetical protein